MINTHAWNDGSRQQIPLRVRDEVVALSHAPHHAHVGGIIACLGERGHIGVDTPIGFRVWRAEDVRRTVAGPGAIQ